jgi:very-short-patch-repair endonuclease
MMWILFIAVALILGAILLKLNPLKGNVQNLVEETWPFYARKPLSEPEQILYFRLIKALPEHIVLAQVQLSRLLGVKKGNNSQAWFNRINRLSADFVVCNKDSSVVAVIELDDASHEREDRQKTDAKKDKALASAGVRMIRWRTKALPDDAAIKQSLLPYHLIKVM